MIEIIKILGLSCVALFLIIAILILLGTIASIIYSMFGG